MISKRPCVFPPGARVNRTGNYAAVTFLKIPTGTVVNRASGTALPQPNNPDEIGYILIEDVSGLLQ